MIIASVIGDSEEELLLRARLAVKKGADMVELRIDHLDSIDNLAGHGLSVPIIIAQRPLKKELLQGKSHLGRVRNKVLNIQMMQ